MDAQLQIRQNALEAQDYMRDLLDWQQTLKQKAGSSNSAAARDVPAVRGRAAGTVPDAPMSMQQPALQPSGSAAPRSSNPAAHTHKNYSKWDKLDVDAALEDTDQPAVAKKHPSASTSKPLQPVAPMRGAQPSTRPNAAAAAAAPPSPAAPPAASAVALKDRGNKLFLASYYGDAITCYSQSIELQPTSLAYANRAMAQLKLGRHAEAEQDCTAALQLDSSYIKALHRRGTARKQLGKLLEAAADFDEALRLEPSNKTVQADRDEVLAKYLKQERIQPATNWSSIPVETQQQQQQAGAQAEAAAAASTRPSSRSSTPVPAAAAAAANSPPAGAGASSSSILSSSGSPPAPVLPAAGAVTSPNGAAGIASSSSSSAAGTATKLPLPPGEQQPPTPASAAAAAAAAQLAARLAVNLKPPRTSNDFEAAWRSFKGDTTLQAKYLKLVTPQQLPAVFKTSLTAPMMTAILTVALSAAAGAGRGSSSEGSQDLDAVHAVALIEQLVRVPRFDMTAMCLSSKDKAALRQLWDEAAAACNLGLRGQLDGVRAKYRL